MRALIGERLHGQVLHTRTRPEGAERPVIELGVNVDHVATVRQARRTYEPDPVWAAVEAHLGGADGITVHLREDRRHIQDEDVRRLRELTHIKLNLEMAATDEMVGIACALKPEMAMLVPEGRARGHHRGRPRHRRRRRSALKAAVEAARRRRHRRLACSSTPSSRRSRRRRASAPRVCEIHTGPVRARVPFQGPRRREPRGGGGAGEDPHGGRRHPRARHALQRRPRAQLLQRAAGRARCPACASCTSATRSSAARVFVGMREAVREMKAPDGAGARGDLRRRHRRGRDRAHRRARSSASASASRSASCARRSSRASSSHRLPANYLAKRFAAKEAFTKALGTGIHAPVNWHGVWVSATSLPASRCSSSPTPCRQLLSKQGISSVACLAHRRARRRRGHGDPGVRKVRLPPGPVVVDVVGPTLTDEDRERLRHPAAGGVILFSRNYENPEQLDPAHRGHRASCASLRCRSASTTRAGACSASATASRAIPPMRDARQAVGPRPAAGARAARAIGYVIGAELARARRRLQLRAGARPRLRRQLA